MSLQKASLGKTVINQINYKINSNLTAFLVLIILQLVGLLLAIANNTYSGSGNGQINIIINHASNDASISFGLICIFIFAIILTTKNWVNINFTLVSNHTSNWLSNIGVLVVFSVFGAITGSLTNIVLRFIILLRNGASEIMGYSFFVPVADIFKQFTVLFLYSVLISSTAYFIGSLTKLHKSLKLIVPVFIIILLFYGNRIMGSWLFTKAKWFTGEDSLPVFTAKALIASAMIYGISLLISSRLEVRK